MKTLTSLAFIALAALGCDTSSAPAPAKAAPLSVTTVASVATDTEASLSLEDETLSLAQCSGTYTCPKTGVVFAFSGAQYQAGAKASCKRNCGTTACIARVRGC